MDNILALPSALMIDLTQSMHVGQLLVNKLTEWQNPINCTELY